MLIGIQLIKLYQPMSKLQMARGGGQVQQLKEKIKSMVFKISKFSDELLKGLDNLNNWPNKVKVMQKNWIGKSYGCEIEFKIEGNSKQTK